MSLIVDLRCTHCDLKGKRLNQGTGDCSHSEIRYCVECERLRQFATLRYINPDDKRLFPCGSNRCHLDHTLVGPLYPDPNAPIDCPRCQKPTLQTESFAIGD